MANSGITKELADRIRDDITIEAQSLVSNDGDAVRALKLNDAVNKYLKLRVMLLKYVAERKPT